MQILPSDEYHKIGRLLEEVPFNKYFTYSVIDGDIDGTIYVDDVEDPRNAYILHPYGMSLLIGDGKDEEFNSWLFPFLLDEGVNRRRDEWMQVHPGHWTEIIERALPGGIVRADGTTDDALRDNIVAYGRTNFRFNEDRFRTFSEAFERADVQVRRLDERTADMVKGTVVPSAFWNSTHHFVRKGMGFSVFVDDAPVSTAFSAFVHGDAWEIGIETAAAHRRNGYAALAAIAFIENCLGNGLTPVWSCRTENTGSYRLATKLGFEPTFQLPFYRLCRH
ncbi:MAG: GNAT family N-acetyltransferase [Methanomassiliicoccales archaeon]|nr:GNAT family N-acetyltransferase [Methanomassiliicoccales archaeon]